MKIYVVIGIVENVSQNEIGGPYESSYDKEIVEAFRCEAKAKSFIIESKLKKPFVGGMYLGDVYYSGGYREMEIEETELE